MVISADVSSFVDFMGLDIGLFHAYGQAKRCAHLGKWFCEPLDTLSVCNIRTASSGHGISLSRTCRNLVVAIRYTSLNSFSSVLEIRHIPSDDEPKE